MSEIRSPESGGYTAHNYKSLRVHAEPDTHDAGARRHERGCWWTADSGYRAKRRNSVVSLVRSHPPTIMATNDDTH